jgi:hypothetical protein
MYENLNPPTVCLVVLGVAQLALFQLARPRIRAWARRADASRPISAVGERAMTVYLWHMPVLVGLAGALLVANAAFGLALPEPMSAGWWATRPLWLSTAAVAVVCVTLVFARFERARRAAPGRDAAAAGTAPAPAPTSRRAAAFDAACGVAGVAVVLVAGFGPVQAGIALALLTIALLGSTSIGPVLARATAALRAQRRSRRNGIAMASQAATTA